MLLTITSTAPDASDLGYLLHKHPDRVQSVELPVGRATVFYPEADADRCTAALLLEVAPIDLVRGRGKRSEGFALGQYVNDRPYAASSLLAVALGKVFGTALKGRCDARPELAASPLPLQIRVPALPAKRHEWRDGAELVRDLFEPLGWTVTLRRSDLAEGLAGFDWGPAPYVDLTLQGQVRLADALTQLYVLLPVLDGSKHYWVGPQEVDKLLRAGEGWLAAHPERALITRRYLAAQRSLVDDATSRLVELDDRPAGELEALGQLWCGCDADDDCSGDVGVDALSDGNAVGAPDCAPDGADARTCTGDAADEGTEPSGHRPLKVLRRKAVVAALREVGAARVVDLGCGEGYYLQGLLADSAFTELLGVDVSAHTLSKAAKRLRLDRRSEREQHRLQLRQSSLTYRDDALTGYDAALLVEVVEHLEPDRLPSLEVNVFGHARPRAVVVTTPNVEYNAVYGMPPGEFRHRDHRFEWSRAQFERWARGVAERHGYTVGFRPVGEVDGQLGSPTQLGLFVRAEDRPPPEAGQPGGDCPAPRDSPA
ncbi:3' terminal RNA ribose 2'-O-methyltransferase Hen1 [Kineosphaera limosa]|uniref:3' terminal RNA ribose 2'-O-methyltransferase Hen1 n=1 Tax=Kineosphaera limosa TaxID=111564 RepID=UPI000A04A652|nr:3' terminal RNA ribose 2'-O-methyltransferase Hen1 [Kineosphaera limosa]